jgi:hypothetical protein
LRLINVRGACYFVQAICSRGGERTFIMPWRKYSPRAGRYGPIYPISRGTSVRKDARGYWVLFFEKQLVRKNQTYGKGRRALVAAIKAGEEAASERPLFDGLLKPPEPENEPMPDFFSFCQTWFKAGQSRWAKFTIQRYTSVLAIYIEPEPLFRKQLESGQAAGREGISALWHANAARRWWKPFTE